MKNVDSKVRLHTQQSGSSKCHSWFHRRLQLVSCAGQGTAAMDGSPTAQFGFQLWYLPSKLCCGVHVPVSCTPCEPTRSVAPRRPRGGVGGPPRKMKDGGCQPHSLVSRREDMLKQVVSFWRALKDAQVWAGRSWEPPWTHSRDAPNQGESWDFGQYLGVRW